MYQNVPKMAATISDAKVLSMPVKLFILGRPGSGKSHAARYIAGYLKKHASSSIHINDYQFLYEQFCADVNEQKKRFHDDGRGGFVVDDITAFDEALDNVKQQAIEHFESELYDLLIIEFARSDYSVALQRFDPKFLRDAYFLFMDADVKTCIKRLNNRSKRRKFPDDHHISEDVMKKFYTKDNRLYMMVGLVNDYHLDHRQVKIIDNIGSIRNFEFMTTNFIDYLIAVEKENSRLRETDPVQNISPVISNCQIVK